MSPTVVVLTRDQDVAADLVIVKLVERAARVVRLDLADFPARLTQNAYLSPDSGWTGTLTGRYRDVELSTVESVWYRRPSPFAFHPELTSTEWRWAAAEAHEGFAGLLTALPQVRWVNHPHRNAEALRPRQLSAAVACGLTVPETLLTNDPDRAREFCHRHAGHGVLYKSLTGGPPSEAGRRIALSASPVTAEQITDAVRHTTHLFQRRVPGAQPVRLTVVGPRLLAARLDGRSPVEPVEVPAPVAEAVRRLMSVLGLRFATPDFVVGQDGVWYFVGDLNPNGQWAWVEQRTGLPIAAALADELLR